MVYFILIGLANAIEGPDIITWGLTWGRPSN